MSLGRDFNLSCRVAIQGRLVISLVLLIFLFIGLWTPYWEISTENKNNYGLWRTCTSQTKEMTTCQWYSKLLDNKLAYSDYRTAVFVLVILGVVAELSVLVIALVAIFLGGDKELNLPHVIITAISLITGVILITGTVIWRAKCVPLIEEQTYPSFSFILSLLSGMCAVVVGFLLFYSLFKK